MPHSLTIARLHSLNNLLEAIYNRLCRLRDILRDHHFTEDEIAILKQEHSDTCLATFITDPRTMKRLEEIEDAVNAGRVSLERVGEVLRTVGTRNDLARHG